MKRFFGKILWIAVSALFLIVPLSWSSTPSVRTFPANVNSLEKAGANGEFIVYVPDKDTWREVARLGFDRFFREREFDLSPFLSEEGSASLRMIQKGGGASHLDAVSLGGVPPETLNGLKSGSDFKKIGGKDFDVMDTRDKQLDLVFPSGRIDGKLKLVARVEDLVISKEPFLFPPDNLHKPMSASSGFYRYDIAHAGTGELKPVFKEYSHTGTGHPSGFTYGWTGHDDKNLYVKIDFTPDNTRDGNEDYAKVYVKTGDGLKEFKISEPETRWGSPDFTYTNKVVYQHKVYTFTIPFSEIGLDTLQNRKELPLAFAAYGTAAPGDYATGIAYDPFAKRHLAVFYSRPGGSAPDEIRGQFVNCDGTPTGLDFLISTAPSCRTDPSVAFDSVNRNFLVVWQDARSGDWDIYGQLVSSGGSLTCANFPISTALNSQNRPAIAFDGVNQRFLVAWVDNRNEDTGDLYGQLVNANATLNGSDFGIAVVAGSNQFDPAVAFDNVNQRFLVAWADSRVSYLDLYAQQVNANGTLQGSYFVISAAANVQRVPSVAFDSLYQRFFVAWCDARNGPTGDLYGQLINADGSLMGANIAVSTAADSQGMPSVSFNSSAQTFLVVWQDFRSGNFDIYGQYMTAVGTLSGGNFLVSGGTGDQLTPEASYGSSTSNFVVALGTTATGVPDLAFTLLGPACATVLVPVPDIKVNSSDCPITVSVEDTVSIAISLDPGDAVSETADWWLVELTPAGTLNYLDLFTASFTPGFATTYQGPLFGFGSTLILNLSNLTIGSHTYYFIIDTNINGSLDVAQLYFDYVLVTSEATKSFNTEAQ